MFIELVDSLRCVSAHEDTWLVAGVTRMDGRRIVEGKLGCPVCRREYPVRDGVAWFAGTPFDPEASRLTHAPAPAPEDRAMRAAALLGLTDAGGIVVLGGSWADCAEAIAELGPSHVVVLNRAIPIDAPQTVSCLVVGDRLPFAAGSVRAVALDAELAATSLGSATGALRARGRLVAPASTPVPPDVSELARDEQDWVAERVAVASPPVALRSARR
jgi:uncharacterized protein YbaR (Trm112 family)